MQLSLILTCKEPNNCASFSIYISSVDFSETLLANYIAFLLSSMCVCKKATSFISIFPKLKVNIAAL